MARYRKCALDLLQVVKLTKSERDIDSILVCVIINFFQKVAGLFEFV